MGGLLGGGGRGTGQLRPLNRRLRACPSKPIPHPHCSSSTAHTGPPLFLLSTLGALLAFLAAAATVLAASRTPAAVAATLFIARGASMGAYTTLYIYTPEAYPTRVRSLALGVNSGLARIGALVSPTLAVTAARNGHASTAEGALAAAAAIAAGCGFCLRVETGGRQLTVTEVAPPSLETPSIVRARSRRVKRAATLPGRVGEA